MRQFSVPNPKISTPTSITIYRQSICDPQQVSDVENFAFTSSFTNVQVL